MQTLFIVMERDSDDMCACSNKFIQSEHMEHDQLSHFVYARNFIFSFICCSLLDRITMTSPTNHVIKERSKQINFWYFVIVFKIRKTLLCVYHGSFSCFIVEQTLSSQLIETITWPILKERKNVWKMMTFQHGGKVLTSLRLKNLVLPLKQRYEHIG